MKTIIQSGKTRGFTYGRRCGAAAANVPSCSFLMCFSLPESNSFPGPRQLHINWPRRQCQDYSVQVLRRCHRQLNIDLEVCSSPSLAFLSFTLPPVPRLFFHSSLHARLFGFNVSFANADTAQDTDLFIIYFCLLRHPPFLIAPRASLHRSLPPSTRGF